MPGYVLCVLLLETQRSEHTGYFFLIGDGIRIAFACLGTQCLFVHATAGFETVVPDVVRPQFASQTVFDLCSHGFHLLAAKQLPEQTVHFCCRHLYISLKIADDSCRHRRAISVHLLHGMEHIQYLLIACIRFPCALCFVAFYFVAIRIPNRLRVVDHFLWNLLTHNTLHHLIDHLLLLLIVVIYLEFVTQVPVTQQSHAVRKELASVLCAQTIHADVVIGYVVLRSSHRFRHTCLYVCRHTAGEHIAQTCFRPLSAAPVSA